MVIEPGAIFRGPAARNRNVLLWPLCVAWMLAATSVSAGNYFQGVSPATLPWPGGIVPYRFDTNYTVTTAQKNVILAGLREWELAASVKFVPYTNQANYVLLQYTNDGSGTGYYLSGTPGTMMLRGLARGLMCHEGGHLLGLQHEHQRNDRDNYILVNTNDILGGTNADGSLSAFGIDTNSTSFGAYDLVSVMHYGPGTFANGLGDSLDPLPAYGKFYHKLGNFALSSGDRAAVSNLYGATLTPLSNIVTNTADGGFGSLRAAVYYANDHPGTTVRFNIPTGDPGYSNGVFTISLLGELPPLVSAGTIIDGTTQSGINNHPVIVLDGSQVPVEAGAVSGLHLYGTNCTVRALAFNNFSYAGVQLFCSDATGNHVENCYLGLRPDGTNAAPNFFAGAIFQFGAHDNFIGGLNATQRNIISGNAEYGVILNDTNSDRNVFLGNYLGLDASGTFAVSNSYSGIGIWNGPHGTIIGGTNAGARNVLSGNTQYGIYISGPDVSGTIIQGNFIGTDFSGSNSVPNGNAGTNSFAGIGIFSGAHDNVIGGTNALARNLISGNTNAGIYLAGSGVTNNLIQGNYLGPDVSGTAALPFQQNGVFLLDGASGNLIGGPIAGARNVISGNEDYGIYISDPGTSNNFIQGNFIGTDVTGTNALGNGSIGIGIWTGASGNFIGGVVTGAGNLISGNTNYGVACGGANANVIQGNLIGTDRTGTNALANEFTGLAIWGAATNNLVGGTTPGTANIISGNVTYGLFLSDADTSGNFVEGNFIGTDISGTNALANGFAGLAVFDSASGNFIGGTTPGAANIISGNYYGVLVSDPGTSGNFFQGNFIGTDISGTNALGNDSANVVLQSGATGNFIGGVGPGAGNVIAFSSGPGVLLYDPETTNNSIRGNSIFSNTGLGIDLNGDGVTPGHSGFLAGPNELQNFPIITNAFGSGTQTIISGTLNSTAGNTFLIDVYRNVTTNFSGYGEGRFYVGTVSVTTDGAGNGIFSLTNLNANLAGQFFTATATAASGDTSEFGADVLATNVTMASAQFIGPFNASASGFNFSLTLQAGFNYRIQAATNLAANPVPWIDLTNFIATNSSLTFTDRTATNFRARFYRVVSP